MAEDDLDQAVDLLVTAVGELVPGGLRPRELLVTTAIVYVLESRLESLLEAAAHTT